MASQAHISTTVLGKTYAGRPMRLAFSIWKLEQEGKADAARALLAAHNRVRSAFGGEPYDLAADFTDLPMEGWAHREGRMMIAAIPKITAQVRPLNERLHELVAKELNRTATRKEVDELNALCAALEAANG